MNSKRTLAILPLLGALSVQTLAHASGLGNVTYTDAELFKPVAHFGGHQAPFAWTLPKEPSGSNTVIMLHQKLIVPGTFDSGVGGISFHTYDMTDPRKPVLQKTYFGTPETSIVRELHAMPVALIDGKTFLAVPTVKGVQFFDFTDPMDPKPSGSLDFAKEGVAGGDYDNTIWMLSWQYPYLYAGGTSSGIFIVDATDPAHPVELPRMPTGKLSGIKVGPIYAAGNYVVGMNMNGSPTQVAVVDMSNPMAPSLLTTGKTPANLYSTLVIGDRIYGPGSTGEYAELKWSSTAVSIVATGQSGSDRGGYCGFQTPFVICGQSSEGFKKWDTTGDQLKFVGNGRDPNVGDYDFATVLGNVVYLGNDHGTGAALIPHQTAPDTVPPAVLKVYPSEAKQPLSTRITIFFGKDIDLDTVNSGNIVVRTVAGALVPGAFSKSSFDAISFSPKAPLAADTTYEVYVAPGGVQDLVGNKVAAASATRFSTGATVDTMTVTTPVMGGGGATGAGGASGQAGAAGAGMGGASVGGAGGASVGGASAGGAGGSVTDSAGAPAMASGGSTPIPSSGGSAGAVTPQEPSAASGSCSCSMPGSAPHKSAWALTIGALFVGLGRLRGGSRRRAGKALA